ncbi:MAG: TatD family hydrolase [Candidatus Cryptobacteroides sp.]
MKLIDTHTHLYDEAFAGEEIQAVDRAVEAGVEKMILPDIDGKSREAMFSLAARRPGILFPCLGVHPTSVGQDWKKEVEMMEKEISNRRIYAIGEVGLDFYWSKEFMQEQETVFGIMLDHAERLDLPVIIHSRESTGRILEILKSRKRDGLRGVFHAFSGSIETFRELENCGKWYVGIGGVVTFRKASIAETVKDIPLSRIILETDSPYLTPVPKRGTRNESAYVKYVAETVARLKGVSIEELAAETSANAEDLFRI